MLDEVRYAARVGRDDRNSARKGLEDRDRHVVRGARIQQAVCTRIQRRDLVVVDPARERYRRRQPLALNQSSQPNEFGPGTCDRQSRTWKAIPDPRKRADRRGDVVDRLEIARDDQVRRVAKTNSLRWLETPQVDDVGYDEGRNAILRKDPPQIGGRCHAQGRPA